MRLCHALYLRRGVLSSLLLAFTTFANVCSQNLRGKKKTTTWLERVRNLYSLSTSVGFEILHGVVRAILLTVEDEEDACDQWALQFLLCHVSSDRSISVDGLVSVHVEELHVWELFAETRHFLSWHLGAGRRLRPVQGCFRPRRRCRSL